MSVNHFTDRFLSRLKTGVSENLSYYSTSQAWVGYFANSEHYMQETGIECSELPQLILPDSLGKRTEYDSENAVRLHKALNMLTPVQAMDQRLWACLTHCVWWDYMTTRWKVKDVEQDRAVQYVIRRYFLEGSGLHGLALNGLSRLWWAAHLTYDDSRSDPYELTKVFMSRSDIPTGLLERSIGKNRYMLCHFVEFLKERMGCIEEAWKNRGGFSPAIQQMAREMNRRGGVVLLDALDRTEVHNILDAVMEPAPLQ